MGASELLNQQRIVLRKGGPDETLQMVSRTGVFRCEHIWWGHAHIVCSHRGVVCWDQLLLLLEQNPPSCCQNTGTRSVQLRLEATSEQRLREPFLLSVSGSDFLPGFLLQRICSSREDLCGFRGSVRFLWVCWFWITIEDFSLWTQLVLLQQLFCGSNLQLGADASCWFFTDWFNDFNPQKPTGLTGYQPQNLSLKLFHDLSEELEALQNQDRSFLWLVVLRYFLGQYLLKASLISSSKDHISLNKLCWLEMKSRKSLFHYQALRETFSEVELKVLMSSEMWRSLYPQVSSFLFFLFEI